MATKCIVLGDNNPAPIEKRKIEFIKMTLGQVNGNSGFHNTSITPSSYNNIELVCRGSNNSDDSCKYYDIMFAYMDGRRNDGMLFLGYWNDGVV